MSSSERRLFLLGCAAALSGCGFTPVYGRKGGGAALYDVVALQEATSPESFAFRERMRRRIGDGGATRDFGLSWVLDFEESGVAVTRTSDITRYIVRGEAKYRLVALDTGQVADEGVVFVTGAYNATADVFATRTAARDERERIATELAELTATRLQTRNVGAEG